MFRALAADFKSFVAKDSKRFQQGLFSTSTTPKRPLPLFKNAVV